ncbi:transmembrane transporter [Malassezia pachydermatis]
MTASMFTGMMIGALGWGVWADQQGRHGVYRSTLLVAAFGGLGLSMAPTYLMACFFSIVLGTGIGGSMPIDGTLLLESLPHALHHWLTGLSVCFALGSVICAGLAYTILPACNDASCAQAWRHLVLVLSGLTLAAAIARRWGSTTYESPRFLAAQGRWDDMALVLEATSTLDEDEAWIHDEPDPAPWREQVGHLVSRPCRRTTYMVWLLWANMSLGFTMFNALYPLLLQRKQADVSHDVLWYAVSSVPASLCAAAWLRTGATYAMPCMLGATSLSLLLFACARSSLAIRIAGISVSFTANTAYAILYGTTPEMFPTQVRGTACAIASALGRAAGILAPVLASALLPGDDMAPVYMSMLVFVICTGMALYLRH